jgi:hypothetical protein
MMKQTDNATQWISWMFLSTGIFAIIGALYTWGDGPIHLEQDLLSALVPWADLIITGPFSLLAAFGIWKKHIWGHIVGLMVCGIYLFGSALVYIALVWNGPPYPLKLALPPVIGIAFSIIFPLWLIKSKVLPSPQTSQINLKRALNRVRMEEVIG